MASPQLTGLSASVTRILSLSGFPSELKTRDIQAAFSDWENINGGFKIKWRDDTSLLIVFADANTAKRAYLQALAQPPPVLGSPTSSKTAVIRPYDGPDAQQVITTVNARTHGHGQRHGQHSRASISGGVPGVMGVSVPGSNGRKGNNGNGHGNGNGSVASLSGLGGPPALNVNGLGSSAPAPIAFAAGIAVEELTFPRDHSPTLPNVPAHPTLSSLINLSLSPNGETTEAPEAALASEETPNLANAPPANPSTAAPVPAPTTNSTPPRIGDPGKRMVGHALGIKHPGLSNSSSSNSEKATAGTGSGTGSRSESPSTNAVVSGIQRGMSGLSVSEA